MGEIGNDHPAGGAGRDPEDRIVARFAELVRLPDEQIPLDRAAALIAAHSRPEIDVEAVLSELDALAAACPTPTVRGWHTYLFDELGLHGDVANYYDPENSYLDVVMQRRCGLPITLSVLCMEVGRRLGLRLAGVGMPGHFLVQHLDSVPRMWIDPFSGGRQLDRAGCEERFRVVNGDGAPFRDSFLEPVGTRAILTRMLANLRSVLSRQGDVMGLRSVYALRVVIPGTPTSSKHLRSRHQIATPRSSPRRRP